MLFRNALLAVGAILVCAGIGLSLFWLSQMGGGPANEARSVPQPQPQPAEVRREAVLEAAHSLPAGTLIRPADFQWHEIQPGEVRPGTILRKDASETEYLGAITRKDFASGEPLTSRRSRQDHRQAIPFGGAQARDTRRHHRGRRAARAHRGWCFRATAWMSCSPRNLAARLAISLAKPLPKRS